MALRGPWSARRVLVLLFAVEAFATAGDLLLGPWARTHWEELFNAREGVQLACGHFDRAWSWQYRTFCGGCTAEGVLAAPLFRAIGPTVLAWKAIPAGFHLVVTALGAWVAARTVGTRAAGAWLLLTMAAPGYYRELFLLGWGNHAESTAFPLLAIFLIGSAPGRSALPRSALLTLAGLVTGLGLWFCHTSAHALPALVLAALLSGRGWSAIFLAAIPVGALPWWEYHRSRPQAMDFTFDWWGIVKPAPPAALADWLFGPTIRDGLWTVVDYPDVRALAPLWWGLLWVVALAGTGLVCAAVWASRRSTGGAPDRGTALFAPLSFAGLLAAYALRHDLWHNLPDPYASFAFNLRYRAPLVPMLFLGAAFALGWPQWREGLRLLSNAGLVVLVGFGLWMRLSVWDEPRLATFGLRVYQHDGWPDPSVPEGVPKNPLRRAQGRLVDIDEALRFTAAHEDPLPDCRYDHLHETGRRLGMGLVGRSEGDLSGRLATAASLARDGDERHYLAEGIAKSLMNADGKAVEGLPAILDGIEAAAPGLGTAVARAAGRRGTLGFPVAADAESASLLDARVWAGVCLGRGEQWVRERARDGLHRPDPTDGSTEWAGACAAADEVWTGMGRAWARYVGCAPWDEPALARAAGTAAARTAAGLAEGCGRFR